MPQGQNHGRTLPQNVIEDEIFKRIASVPYIRAFNLNDRGDRYITFSVLADNEDDLNTAVAALETALRAEPLLANVSSEGALPRPEVQITPRAEEIARLGITSQQIANTIRVATIGDLDVSLAKMSIDNRQIPILVRMNQATRDDLRLSLIHI